MDNEHIKGHGQSDISIGHTHIVGLPETEESSINTSDEALDIVLPVSGAVEVDLNLNEVITFSPDTPVVISLNLRRDEAPPRITMKMKQVTAAHGKDGETIREVLYRMYHAEGRDFEELQQVTGVHQDTIRKWFRKHDILTRTNSEAQTLAWKDESRKEGRAESMRAAWADEERKAVRVTQLHSPLAKQRRINAVRNFWQADSPERTELLKARRQARYDRAVAIFGNW